MYKRAYMFVCVCVVRVFCFLSFRIFILLFFIFVRCFPPTPSCARPFVGENKNFPVPATIAAAGAAFTNFTVRRAVAEEKAGKLDGQEGVRGQREDKRA